MKRIIQFVFLLLLLPTYLVSQPSWDFVLTEGGTGENGETGYAVTTDDSGNFYVVGTFIGSNDFGGHLLNSIGGTDIFISKYDASGTNVWISQVGGPSDDIGKDIAYDPFTDQILIIGHVQGDESGFVTIIPFGTATPIQIPVIDETSTDILVASFEASTGAFNGEDVFGGAANEKGNSIAIDPLNGDFYITGQFSTSGVPSYFGTNSSGDVNIVLSSNSDSEDIYIGAYDADGVAKWALNFGGIENDSGNAIEVYPDVDGTKIAVTGSLGDGIFLAELNAFGIENWTLNTGSTGTVAGTGVAYDNAGDVYLTGGFSGDITIGSATLQSAGMSDIFIAKAFSDASFAWAKSAGSGQNDIGLDLIINSNGSPVITGTIGGAVSLEATTPVILNFAGSSDVFIAAFDPSTGDAQWGLSAGGSSFENGRGITIFGDNAYVTGDIRSDDAFFGSNPTAASDPPAYDIFIAGLSGINSSTQTTQLISQADSLALVALYNATGGSNWFDGTNWLSGPVSTWYGITVQEDRVFSIDLVDNNLVGSIPAEIGDLTGLDSLFLYSNDFIGTTMPAELGNLTNLKELSLFDTGIGGDIPTSLGNLTQLQVLSLSSNELTGTIPTEFGSLTELTDLYLWGNNLTGEIPASLGNLTKMNWLNLSTNDLSGLLPSSLGNLTIMTYFAVTNNGHSGDIPTSFSNLTNLETLALGGNDFTGTIPSYIGTMTNLTKLYLWGNLFTGNIPTEFSSLTGLIDFYVGSNQLDGPVPNFLNTFTNLEDVSVHDNNFESMPDLSNLANLTILEVANNKLTFEDIIPNLGVASETYTYSPQQTAGEIQTVEAPVGSDYTINLGFDVGVTGSTYEWFFEGTSIGTSTTPTYTVTNFQEANVGTYTAVITNSMAVDLTLTSNDIDIGIGSGTPGACVSQALDLADSRIDRVIFNDLDHVSSEEGDGICIVYSDFKDISTNVFAGQTVDVGFTLGTCEGSYEKGAKMYIDWNQDGQFNEDDELVAWTASIQSDTLAIESYFAEDFYTIPADASLGSYLLRIVVMETDDIVNISGCGEYDYGETEDYTVNVVSDSGDTEAPTVTLISPPTTHVLGSGNVTIQANISDDVGVTTVGFAYGKITEVTDALDVDQMNVVVAEEISTGVYEHTLTNADFDAVGVLYFFVAEDAAGNIAWSTPLPATISSEFGPSALRVNSVSPVSNANDPKETDYRVFSLPVRNATIANVFDVSSMDNEKFRVYQYNGSNIELTSTGAALAPGRGFWLIYLNGEVDLDFGGPAVTSTHNSPFTITLRSGINLIGNPYNFNLSWTAVLNHNIAKGTISDGDISDLTFYQGSFSSGNTTLGVTQGAFVQSNEPFTIEIPLSALTSRLGTRIARKGQNPLDAEAWSVPIDISIAETSYEVSSIGMKPGAEEGRDKYDLLAMPYLEEYLEFNSLNPAFKDTRISQDYVQTQDGYIWEFEARTSYGPGQATISWDNTTFGDNDRELILYDVEGDRVINMREQANHSFYLAETRKFRIYYGDAVFMQEELQPKGISLGKAYPNPFSNSSLIPFTLPGGKRIYRVRVEIYNATGQRVKVLKEGSMGGGYHTLSWDGTNDAGHLMPEGMYIYKLNVGHEEGRTTLNGKVIHRR